MRIRLKVVSPGGASTTFEHPGPVIQIGRDPSCELTLEGPNSDGVSRQHARIELTAEGASLTDVGSSNGTRLNGKLVEAPLPLRPGDHFQLGFTGPTLTVMELNLTVGKRAVLWHSWPTMVGLATAAVLIIGALVYFNRGEPQEVADNPPPKPPPGVTDPPGIQDDKSKKPPVNEAGKPTQPLPNPPIEKPEEPTVVLPERPAHAPDARIMEVGQYLAPSKKLPLTVVLQRLNEQQLWTMLRPGDRVSSGHTLLSLPGYRSALLLDSGVGLLLDGNLPEFSPRPPVLESVVTLHKPPDSFHADLTLERGRVRFAGSKSEGTSRPDGPVKVRLHFLQEVWDVTLLDEKSEAAAELWYTPSTGTFFGLITDGSVRVQKLPAATQDLPPRAFMYWQSSPKSDPAPEPLAELPDWWADPRSLKELPVGDALLSLKDWQGWLKHAGDVTGFIADRVQNIQSKDMDSTHRALGMRFLAALERMNTLLEMQDRPEVHERVRQAAMHALWLWVTQGAARREAFEKMALQRYTDRTTVDTILKLLEFKPEELKAPGTLKPLVNWLGHERLIVRQLAYWHLEVQCPENAKAIEYDPTEGREWREKKVKQWQDAIK